MIEVVGKNGTAKIFSDTWEESAVNHLYRIMSSDFTEGSTVRIMPDYHDGIGAVIGFTQKLDKDNPRICPNTIGVDVMCSVSAYELGELENINFVELDKFIREHIGLGAGGYVNNKVRDELVGYAKDSFSLFKEGEEIIKRDAGKDYMNRSLESQLFSIGSGNHYIEINKSSSGSYWLNLHCGSRNFGHRMATFYQKKAEEYKIADIKDLSYLDRGSEYFNSYLKCSEACFHFVSINHRLILSALRNYLTGSEGLIDSDDIVFTPHNYIELDNMIVRKGAVAAYKNQTFLVPFNMRDGIGIFKGKGNEDYNYSAPHGCGRLMSRSQAKKRLNLDDVKREMKDADIFTTSLDYALDEAPDAYKAVEDVLVHVEDTAELIEILKPIYNIKG